MTKNEFCNQVCENADICITPIKGFDVTVSSENICLKALSARIESSATTKLDKSSYLLEKAIRSKNKRPMRQAAPILNALRGHRDARSLKPGLFWATVPALQARLERRFPNNSEIDETIDRMSSHLARTIKYYFTLLQSDERDRRGATQGTIGEAAVTYLSFLNRAVTGEGSLIYPSFMRERNKDSDLAHHAHTVEPNGDRRLVEITTRTLQQSGPGKIALRELCGYPFMDVGDEAYQSRSFLNIIDALPLSGPTARQANFGLGLASEIQSVVDSTPTTPATY